MYSKIEQQQEIVKRLARARRLLLLLLLVAVARPVYATRNCTMIQKSDRRRQPAIRSPILQLAASQQQQRPRQRRIVSLCFVSGRYATASRQRHSAGGRLPLSIARALTLSVYSSVALSLSLSLRLPLSFTYFPVYEFPFEKLSPTLARAGSPFVCARVLGAFYPALQTTTTTTKTQIKSNRNAVSYNV